MPSTARTADPAVRNHIPWATDLVITGAAVICAMVMWLAAGLIVLRGLERFGSRGLRAWTVIALAAAALSALAPLSVTPVETRGTLLGLHGVVAAVVIVGARRSRRSSGI